MSNIDTALKWARQQIEAGEARLLLRHLLDCSSAHIEAHRDDELDPIVEQTFHAWVERRRQGEPVAYLMQMREFYGRCFFVAPGVLIPRPETELIVDILVAKCRSDIELRVLDMGTGSGCLAITLALELPHADVIALDVLPDALAIAKRNAVQLGAQIRFLESDWFASVGDERFDVIVSNPPYIADRDPHLAEGDLRFEPARALASGTDGLDAIRTIVKNASAHLNPGGRLLFEHGYDQADRVLGLLESHAFMDIEQQRDLANIVRVSGGRAAG